MSPHWDAEALAATASGALHDPAGPLGYAWRHLLAGGSIAWGRDGTTTPVTLEQLHRVPVSEAGRHAGTTERTRFVCVIDVYELDADRAIRLVAETSARTGAHVEVITRGPADHAVARQIGLLTLAVPNLSLRSAPRREDESPATEAGDGVTVFRSAGAEVSAAGIATLMRAAESEPVAALWLAPDGTIVSAGGARVGDRDIRLFHGHPTEDVAELGSRLAGVALDSPVIAARGNARRGAHGTTLLDVITTKAEDPQDLEDHQATEPTVTIAEEKLNGMIRRSGFVLADASTTNALRRERGAGRRRWAIKTSAPAGRAGESWGDLHFARDLAGALERAGEFAVVDALPAAHRPTTEFDDVTLVLRGPHRIKPPRHGVRILWIISHPDQITAAELDDFDVVFAGSELWAVAAARGFGRPIEPLLQCTDARLFHPTGAPRSKDIVFVGTARGIPRQVVTSPIRAAIDVKVFGPDWRGFIPGERIAGTSVPHADLPGVYERAGVILNDHWPAMRREGFISNRLYDVVAAGGRAISDQVVGIPELFGPAVRTFRNEEELIGLLTSDLDEVFWDARAIAQVSTTIRQDHSFDARARRLLLAAE